MMAAARARARARDRALADARDERASAHYAREGVTSADLDVADRAIRRPRRVAAEWGLALDDASADASTHRTAIEYALAEVLRAADTARIAARAACEAALVVPFDHEVDLDIEDRSLAQEAIDASCDAVERADHVFDVAMWVASVIGEMFAHVRQDPPRGNGP